MKKKLLFVRNHLFTLCISAFILHMLIFSEHSLWHIQRVKSEQRSVRAKIEDYKRRTEEYKLRIGEITDNDPKRLESYAREKLGMKRANEDVFVFDD